MSTPIVLSAPSPSQATTKVKECIDTWRTNTIRNPLGSRNLEILLNCATSGDSFILTVALKAVIDHYTLSNEAGIPNRNRFMNRPSSSTDSAITIDLSTLISGASISTRDAFTDLPSSSTDSVITDPSTQSSEASNPTLAGFMDLLSSRTDSVIRDLEAVTATLPDPPLYLEAIFGNNLFNLTISAKAHIATSAIDPTELGNTPNTFTANSMSTAHGYLGLRIAQCLELGVDQWGYIVSAYSGSKFRIDIRNPKGDKRGTDKQSFLALAKDNMETMQAWVYSGYLKQNDMNIGISSTGSAIVRLAYIGKVSVSATDSEQYDKYAGKETISSSYWS